MNKIDLASKPDAPLHYLRFRCSSRKCGDRIRKINVAPGLETVEISNVPLFYFFFFRPISVPGIFPKGLSQSEMDDHLDGELLYILMIFSNLFSIFNSID